MMNSEVRFIYFLYRLIRELNAAPSLGMPANSEISLVVISANSLILGLPRNWVLRSSNSSFSMRQLLVSNRVFKLRGHVSIAVCSSSKNSKLYCLGKFSEDQNSVSVHAPCTRAANGNRAVITPFD